MPIPYFHATVCWDDFKYAWNHPLLGPKEWFVQNVDSKRRYLVQINTNNEIYWYSRQNIVETSKDSIIVDEFNIIDGKETLIGRVKYSTHFEPSSTDIGIPIGLALLVTGIYLKTRK